MDRRIVAGGGAALGLLALAWWSFLTPAGPHPEGNNAEAKAETPSAQRPGAARRAPQGTSPSGSDDPSDAPRATEDPTVALGGASEFTDEELAAFAEELEADPRTHVVCDLGLDVRFAEAYLAIGDPSGFNGRRVKIVNGKAYLPLVYDLGDLGDKVFSERTGTFSLEGYGPGSIAWTDQPEEGHGQCTGPVSPEPGRASLTGTLTLSPSGAPAAGAWIEGCGNMAYADQHGVVHMDIVPDPCTVLAMRQDGMLRTISDSVSVFPEAGRDVIVDIEIPEAPRGGLGVQVSQDDAGRITIDGILEAGPAGAAGLQEGDVVVMVDGEPTDRMSLGEFVKAVGGEAGTSVDLTVDRNGEQLSIDVTREVLSAG